MGNVDSCCAAGDGTTHPIVASEFATQPSTRRTAAAPSPPRHHLCLSLGASYVSAPPTLGLARSAQRLRPLPCVTL